jgi:hypothetical protein
MLVLINLQRADVRRARMTAQLDDLGIPFERLGHDFRGRNRTEIVRWYAAHFPSIRPAHGTLSGAELGCWASHLSAWARIRESGEAAGTVLEDDLVLAAVAISMPVDHFLGGRGGAVRPRIGVVQPACVREDPRTARESQIQPHTWRPDRSRVVEGMRRRFLDSRASDWFYRIYRWL